MNEKMEPAGASYDLAREILLGHPVWFDKWLLLIFGIRKEEIDDFKSSTFVVLHNVYIQVYCRRGFWCAVFYVFCSVI